MTQRFRAGIITFALAVMFFIPVSAIPEKPPETTEKTEVPEDKTPTRNEEKSEEEQKEDYFRIYDMESGKIENVSFSDYIRGAIACEMGADFEFDALVAQGIAAFTCGIYQKNAHEEADYDFSAAPEKKLGYITEEKAKEIYGDSFEEKWGIICSAAEKAEKYIILYEDEPALTVYHAISNGRTESSKNAWGGEVPYLISVKSPGDAFAKGFESEVKIKKNIALDILNKNGAGLSGEYPEQWFEGEVLTEGGYVDYIEIGAATFSGEKLRSLFGLRSASFSVKYSEGEFVFNVRGYGHGVGLSQVGANHMAEKGSDFKEIIAHYYPGTKLEEYKKFAQSA